MAVLKRQTLYTSLLLLATGVLATAGWLAQSPPGQVAIAVPCEDPVAGCELPAHGLVVRFDRPASALQPFRLRVTLSGSEQPYARFRMLDMEMGLNRYRLLADGNGGWEANVILPACVQGRHDWTLELESGDTLYRLPFTSHSGT